MSPRLHVVAEMQQFLRDTAAAGVGDDEHQAIIDAIAADPRQGDEIRASGGVRKVRFRGAWQRKERRLSSRDGLLRTERTGVPRGPAKQR